MLFHFHPNDGPGPTSEEWMEKIQEAVRSLPKARELRIPWSPRSHRAFDNSFRAAVLQVLLIRNRAWPTLDRNVLYLVFQALAKYYPVGANLSDFDFSPEDDEETAVHRLSGVRFSVRETSDEVDSMWDSTIADERTALIQSADALFDLESTKSVLVMHRVVL